MKKEARKNYVDKVLSFVNIKKLKPLKVVANCGNGAAGPTLDAINRRMHALGGRLDFINILHKPDHKFPHGIIVR